MPRCIPAVCCLLLALSAPARAAGPFDDLLKYAPADTNAMALIDVKAAFASPLAKKENWAEKAQAGGRGGLGFLGSDTDQVVIAAAVNLTTLTRESQVGLVKMRNVPNMQELAIREGGTPDEIAGRLAVLSPRNVYFTALSGSELAAVYPADRQYTARWLRAARAAKTPALSPYLMQAAQRAAGNALTIALDLEDAVDRNLLKLSLTASPTVAKQKDLDIGLLATFLAQVKGMTFTAKVGDAITGTLVVEFPIEPARHRKILSDLILELIEGEGVWIPGIDNWEVKYTDTTISFSGPMTTADLKHVVSLFAFPQAAGEESGAKTAKVSVPATRRYLAAVSAILDDIRATKMSKNYDKTATWHEKAADQIEHLNRRMVDPIATNAAFQAAKRLRAIGESLRGVPIDVKALESQEYYYSRPSVGVMPGGWWGWAPFIYGPNKVDTNIPQIRSQIAKVIADDQKQRDDAWSAINRIMADAKKALSDKYKTPF